MSTTTKLRVVVAAAVAGLFFSPVETATADVNPTITITNEGDKYVFSPAELAATAGQAVTVTNNDAHGVHSVTAKDRSFSVDVPPKSSATFTVAKAGTYPYYCQYHLETHNAASITVS